MKTPSKLKMTLKIEDTKSTTSTTLLSKLEIEFAVMKEKYEALGMQTCSENTAFWAKTTKP